jgi:hypothetical protein
VRDALHQQPRRDQQDARDSDLDADQQGAHPPARAVGKIATVAAQRRRERRADRSDRRQHADEER